MEISRTNYSLISVICSLFMLLAGVSSAQIKYTPADTLIIADTVQQFEEFDVFFTGSTTPDFYLKDFHPSQASWAEEVYSKTASDEICIDTASGAPHAFKDADLIEAGAKQVWISTSFGAATYALDLDSNWNGNAHYLGLRIKKGSKYNYGWVKVLLTQAGSGFTILGYAYNTIADSPIAAGQISDGVKTAISVVDDFSVSVSNHVLTVKAENITGERHSVNIYDLLGRRVRQMTFNGSLAEEELGAIPTGSYFVTLDGENSGAKKIYLR